MSTIKKLGAQPMTQAEITKELPVTSLERLTVIQFLAEDSPGSFEEGLRRKDIHQAFMADDGWFLAIQDTKLTASDLEQVHHLVCTQAVLRHLKELLKSVIAKTSGLRSFASIDLYQRVSYVLEGEAEERPMKVAKK